jgi:hypothetical protein
MHDNGSQQTHTHMAHIHQETTKEQPHLISCDYKTAR